MRRPRRQKDTAVDKRGEEERSILPHGDVEDQAEKPVRKNFYLYQSKVDMARKILGAKTETEAINRALDLVNFGEVLARGTREMYGWEYEDDVFGVLDEIPPRNGSEA